MRIGIIGAGEMGVCLATKWVALGHTVSIANSRGPASLKHLADDTGVKAGTVDEVTKEKNVIVVSIPQKNIPELPKTLFKNLSENTVVIDTGNYYPTLRDGNIPALDQSGIDSLWVQEQLDFSIVKAFNAILATSIRDFGRRKRETNRIAIAVSGDNMKAKQTVCSLIEELGFDPFDVGSIAQSWKQQPGSPVYCRDLNVVELKKRIEGMGDCWAEMRPVILGKRKADEALMNSDYSAYLKALQG